MAPKVSQFYTYVVDGVEYKLRYKTPTIGDQIRIGQMYAALKGGFNQLDETSERLAFMVANLNNVILDKPEDLKFDELGVENWSVVTKMFDDYQQFSFFRKDTPESK